MEHGRQDPRKGPGRIAALAALAVLGVATGCQGLLDVELPGQLTEEDLLTPEMARTMVLSAVADYECAYSDFTASVGGLENAFWESTGWYTRAWAEYDVTSASGAVNSTGCGTSNTTTGFNADFQAARFQAEQAYEQITEFGPEAVPDSEELLAMAATYAGYTYQVFGEHWCEVAVDVGPVMTPTQTLQRSEEWFDLALEHLGNAGDVSMATTPSVEQLAHLGRARVRFAMDDHEGAAADAREIQQGFTAWVTRSGSVRERWNQVHHHLTVNKYATIAPAVVFEGDTVSTGYRHLTIDAEGRPTVSDGVPDTRVPVENTGQIGQDGVTPHWIQTKYTSHSDPIPMAKWEEAQLILAEIEGGQQAIDRINAIRDSHGLPRVTYLDASDAEGIQDLIIEERRRTFFLEGRFHADKLRYGLWFPEGTGFNHKGVAYGHTTCLPLGDTERENNPNVS